jgi:peptidoglycan hydrolase-like protein with peptidoglycan-binding domain
MNISQNPQYDFLKIIGVIVVFAGVATFASLSMRSNPLEQTGLVIDQKTTAVTVLKVGTKDAEVQKLEQFLKDKKYFAGIPDTTFGRETEYAVKKFQTAYQIKPTGTFGGKWDPADPSRMPPPSNYTPTVCDADFNCDYKKY